MKALSVPEWRLFLLSTCVVEYKELYHSLKEWEPEIIEADTSMNPFGNKRVLNMTESELKRLSKRINLKEDVPVIREKLREEWKFEGLVLDQGHHVYSTCEYCQKQQIRYEYICVNITNGNILKLGSVCVGKIIYGEEKMRDKEFYKEFVDSLDKLKVKSELIETEQTIQNRKESRKQQHTRIYSSLVFIRERGYDTSPFFQSLKKQWDEGKVLTDKQESALIRWASQIKEIGSQNIPIGGVCLSPYYELVYQKILGELEKKPKSDFLKSCKGMLSRNKHLNNAMLDTLLK